MKDHATGDLNEEMQAVAARELAVAGKRYQAAHEAERTAWSELQKSVYAALAAGMRSRRIRELTGISLDTIHRWRMSK